MRRRHHGRHYRIALFALLALSLHAQTLRQEADRLGVKISAAVNPARFNEPAYFGALARELNMIEPENVMKFGIIHPDRERFDFSAGDRIVEFAAKNGMAVRGHTLVWHNQLPQWIKSGAFTPEQLSSILHDHITTVMKHYAGKVWAWDVVNEAFDGNPPKLRSTLWYDAPGIGFKGENTRYIEQAFRWAREADPNALLFYNDYAAETINPKSDAIFAMAKDFKTRAVPLDGIGLQMHVGLKANLSRLGENIERLTALGLQVHITELDVAIPTNPDGTPIDPDSLQKQATIYRDIASTCLRFKGCTAIQTWGITDKYSWIPGSSKGKNGLALPLDANYQPKPAHTALLDAFKSAAAPAQNAVVIRVDTTAREGSFKPITSYFGYDEPNYTYTQNGAKLIAELAAGSRTPVYIRTHHLLCTGDGTPALKWGSTNAYTEDAVGKPIYDWTIVDRIFDTYVKVHARPFVEIGFMPEALSTHPQPYAVKFGQKDSGTGWSYPPKDFEKWSELIYRWVRHSVDRYGRDEVLTWYWELWNEPNISYWRGTSDEYDRLYDYTSAAVKRALPGARVGGPGTTDPTGEKAAAYLRQFLEHCAKTGDPLDFITYHAKGAPKVVDGHVQMGLGHNLDNVAKGYQIVASFPQYRNLPIIVSEYDPEGCAACSARDHPQNAYRNGTVYPTYTAASIKNILLLADRYKTNIEGMLTWAFEFENQPYFAGFRTLATNGIDKPVLNVFRMAGLMRGDRVKVSSSGAVGLDSILQTGVRTQPDIDALATRTQTEASVMLWNYHDDDVPAPDAPVRLVLAGLPEQAARVLVYHYRIDRDHSNAFTVWQQMGSPQQPSPEQYAQLEAAGALRLLESPRWVSSKNQIVELDFKLPRQAVSLVQLTW